jgi:hypothetical protein
MTNNQPIYQSEEVSAFGPRRGCPSGENVFQMIEDEASSAVVDPHDRKESCAFATSLGSGRTLRSQTSHGMVPRYLHVDVQPPLPKRSEPYARLVTSRLVAEDDNALDELLGIDE